LSSPKPKVTQDENGTTRRRKSDTSRTFELPVTAVEQARPRREEPAAEQGCLAAGAGPPGRGSPPTGMEAVTPGQGRARRSAMSQGLPLNIAAAAGLEPRGSATCRHLRVRTRGHEGSAAAEGPPPPPPPGKTWPQTVAATEPHTRDESANCSRPHGMGRNERNPLRPCLVPHSPSNSTVQKEDFPSHQNVSKCMKY
jgi:hypothetical protein